MSKFNYTPIDSDPFSVEVDGVLVDSRSVVVSRQFGQIKCRSLIVVRISKSVLLHELTQADILLESQSLFAYIRDDLLRDIPKGVRAYLAMVHQMAENLEKPNGSLWLRQKSKNDAIWEWCSLQEVKEISMMIEFIGTAQPIGCRKNA